MREKSEEELHSEMCMRNATTVASEKKRTHTYHTVWRVDVTNTVAITILNTAQYNINKVFVVVVTIQCRKSAPEKRKTDREKNDVYYEFIWCVCMHCINMVFFFIFCFYWFLNYLILLFFFSIHVFAHSLGIHVR